MKDINDLKKITVLIDADNAQKQKIRFILQEISAHGHIITKRAYGDWSNENLKYWKSELNELAIQPVQQFAYTSGKNSTDSAMIIDAMDLLYTQKYDAFAIVSSDSDFTRLANRLRESEIFVFGVGETKTPVSFRNACDDFILTENLGNESKTDQEISTPISSIEKIEDDDVGVEVNNALKIEDVLDLLKKACELYQDDDGWCNISSSGTYIKRIKPEFDSRTFGYDKLPDLIKNHKDVFEHKKYKGKGTVNIFAYKLKGK
ncbi:NYN domain-containing protein [Fusibacter ferrireducens]|uniref:NYN domain-containing protein n=1 Tax=Fusibacter ferrireducens TaxID=2785058 RepID=A0ABS0A033_9FIRM|nr:NYN domain-containing protein [Fusibacter ferrireducens]MBF4696058.1 NYN domain-containing protein [Fusibacter ferrireducens]